MVMCAETNSIYHAAVVLRVTKEDEEVGLVDIYYNYRRVHTLKGKYEDIDGSFYSFYFLKPDDGASTNRIDMIPVSWHEMMGEGAVKSQRIHTKTSVENFWSRNKHYAVQQYMKLYQSYFQVKNIFFVAHDRFVSIYFLNEEWFFHLELSDEIVQMESNFFPINEGEDEDHQLNCLLVSGKMETVHLKLNQP